MLSTQHPSTLLQISDTSAVIEEVKFQIKGWLRISGPALRRQPSKAVDEAKAYVEQWAMDEMARNRQASLTKPVAPQSHKQGLRILGVATGMVTMTYAAQMVTAPLGNIALPTALALGGIMAHISETCTSRAYTNRRLRELATAALSTLKQTHRQTSLDNQLAERDYQVKRDLLYRIELEPLVKSTPINMSVALLINTIEYVVTWATFAQFGLAGGPIVPLLAALLPISIQTATSITEGELANLPEACRELRKQYDTYLWPLHRFDFDAVKQVQHQVETLSYRLLFFPAGDCRNPDYTLAMGLAKQDESHWSQRKQAYHKQATQKVSDLETQLQQAIKYLPNQCPYSGVGLTDQELERLCHQWVVEQRHLLEQQYENNLKIIQAEYGQKLQTCDLEIAAAQQRFCRASQR